MEDDPQLTVMTPNSFLFQQPTELQPHQSEERDLKKRRRKTPYGTDGHESIWQDYGNDTELFVDLRQNTQK